MIGVLPESKRPFLERLLPGASERGNGHVPYTSTHLDDAESELIVPADHFHVHQHPLAVLEMRRILMEHAKEADANQKRDNTRQVSRGNTEPTDLMAPSPTGYPANVTDDERDPHMS